MRCNCRSRPVPGVHPVQTLVMTIRKVADMGSSTANSQALGTDGAIQANQAHSKAYFAYHGGGKDPNMDSPLNHLEEQVKSDSTSIHPYLKVVSFNLKLNGQTRHLDGNGLDREYLMDRLMPMLHSGMGDTYDHVAKTSSIDENLLKTNTMLDAEALAEGSRGPLTWQRSDSVMYSSFCAIIGDVCGSAQST